VYNNKFELGRVRAQAALVTTLRAENDAFFIRCRRRKENNQQTQRKNQKRIMTGELTLISLK